MPGIGVQSLAMNEKVKAAVEDIMKNILLLEDDPSLADGLTFALKKQGYGVDGKRTIAEAKAAWSEGAYDLLYLTYPCRTEAVLISADP